MRQLLLSLFQAHDPAMWATDEDGYGNGTDDEHGSGFDRAYATTLGYASGAGRCSEIDTAEMAARVQEFSFSSAPYQYGNVDITPEAIGAITDIVNEYFTLTQPGYETPALTTVTDTQPLSCHGYERSFPVM